MKKNIFSYYLKIKNLIISISELDIDRKEFL